MLPETPAAAFDFLRKAGNGELSLHWRSVELDQLRHELRAQHRRLRLAVTGGGLLISAAVLQAAGGVGSAAWINPATLLLAIAGLGLLLSAWSRRQP
jgi:hypothetical protein